MRHTKKQESVVHTKENSIETDSEWAQMLISAEKDFKATEFFCLFLFLFFLKKEMENFIWAILKIITWETVFQKALKTVPLKQLF